RAGEQLGDTGVEFVARTSGTGGVDGPQLSIDVAAPLFSMLALFKHQERAAGAGNHAAALRALPLPDRLPRAAMQIAGELVAEQHVGMFRLEGAADQHVRRLAGTDARGGCLDRRDACAFLAHEGTRGTGDLVDDGDVAG